MCIFLWMKLILHMNLNIAWLLWILTKPLESPTFLVVKIAVILNLGTLELKLYHNKVEVPQGKCASMGDQQTHKSYYVTVNLHQTVHSIKRLPICISNPITSCCMPSVPLPWVKGHVHSWPRAVRLQWTSWDLCQQSLISLSDFSINSTECCTTPETWPVAVYMSMGACVWTSSLLYLCVCYVLF